MLNFELDEAILEFIQKCQWDEKAFNDLALRIFAYQFERNEPYRNFCLKRNRTPETISHWSEIPPVPVQAFKVLDLACEPKEKAEAIFLSSGTTQGEKTRCRHFVFNLRLYETSVLSWFEPHLLPERKPIPIAILLPPPEEMPNSSLGHMLATILKRWGKNLDKDLLSGWFIKGGTLRVEELANWLKVAEKERIPVMLLGTSFSFVHFLDWCFESQTAFHLPEGSRLMDTGGFKGRSREVSRSELYGNYERVFSIPPEWCVNEYGMAEMCSQFYDGVAGKPYLFGHQRIHKPPPWARTKVVNPETLEEVDEGEVGLLCHYDLANRGSVMAILTEDLGVKLGDGFVLIGRARGSELRGCSVLIDELLSVSNVVKR